MARTGASTATIASLAAGAVVLIAGGAGARYAVRRRNQP
ncbi:LPXTG cell wall anchor domain-containing protein [Streptomyces sp. MST-110588]|nr:LPXTG cell wall anchor domain-containing protein [Streptomyces sp. MST-110588]